MPRHLTTLLAPPLLALSACTAATAAPTTPPQLPPASTTPNPGQSEWPRQQELGDAATTVDETAPSRWPDAYAGVALDMPAQLLLVQRIPTPGFDAAVRAVVPTVTVQFTDARYSKRTLDAWVEQISDDFTYWQGRGIQLHSVGAEPGQYVAVGINNPKRDAGKISARYPRMDLRVVQGSPAVLATAG
ncbi:hypothetical protein [Micromonospora sp. NBC_00421]|uniref:hypothetical protein n=1 Tax=Micromonospora sp. NBC_00421 TaxID=2975976 RepID=UPI002E1B8B93